MSKPVCTFCFDTITKGALVVHDGRGGVSGVFHIAPVGETEGCFEKACRVFDQDKSLGLSTDGASDTTVRPSVTGEIASAPGRGVRRKRG